jgi:glyoxylase I family protein
MGIKVKALQHANIRLRTVEQARDFYGRILGLQEDPTMPWSEEWWRIWWNIGAGGQLHTPIGERVNTTPSGREIGGHFALGVENIDEAKRTLEAEGIQYDEQTIPGRGLQLFVSDPAGNLVELFQG